MSKSDQVPLRINNGDWAPWEGAVEVVGKNGDSLFWTTSGVHGSDPTFIVRAVNAHDELIAALEECAEYFDNKADADHDYETGYIPNKEMRLWSVCDEALKLARKS